MTLCDGLCKPLKHFITAMPPEISRLTVGPTQRWLTLLVGRSTTIIPRARRCNSPATMPVSWRLSRKPRCRRGPYSPERLLLLSQFDVAMPLNTPTPDASLGDCSDDQTDLHPWIILPTQHLPLPILQYSIGVGAFFWSKRDQE